MTKLNKVEGSIEKCPECGIEIFCRVKPASGNFPEKLQWQEKDGSAHYNFDFKTKAVSCKSSQKSESHNSEIITMPKAENVEKEVLERIKKDSKAITYHKIARYMGVKEACEESGITNPAMIGMLFNAVDRGVE